MQPIRSPFRLTGGGKIEIHDPVFLKERTAQRLARYTVKEGDTLASIAAASGVTIAAIVQLNPSISPENLQVGQVLHMPARPQ